MSDLPQPVIDEVNKTLSQFDEDNNNEITWFEIYNYMLEQNVHNPEVMTMLIFDNLDKNKDGVIRLNEIQEVKLQRFITQQNIKQDLSKLINNDTTVSNDQEYSYDQVLETLKNNKSYKDPERVSKLIFKSIDKDNDKTVSKNDIEQYLNNLQTTDE